MANPISISFDPGEAKAVLTILDKCAAGLSIGASDWQVLFESDGYKRLKEREISIDRPFSDDEFTSYVISPEPAARREALHDTLTAWQSARIENALERALAYLPAETPVRATIYPVIKPKPNSFVFDLDKDPAIFLSLDPAINPQQLENILSHELHHIGLTAVQIPLFQSDEWQALPEATHRMLQWVSAFSEGIAMLAAAGGPTLHPHACDNVEEQERWDHSLQTFEADFREVEDFLLQVMQDRLNGQAMLDAGYRFFGIQGPWYTVGYRMAVIIEKTYGREAVIRAFSDPRRLLTWYNRAGAPGQPGWDDRLCVGQSTGSHNDC